MEAQGVEARDAARAPAGAVELIRPLDPEGAIARFMANRGEGFHHVAFAVPDVDATLAELAAPRRRGHRRARPAWGSAATWWRSCTPAPPWAC